MSKHLYRLLTLDRLSGIEFVSGTRFGWKLLLKVDVRIYFLIASNVNKLNKDLLKKDMMIEFF